MVTWLVFLLALLLREAVSDVNDTFGGNCLNGVLVEEKQRSRNNQCGSCDPGYRLHDDKCEGYRGTCKNGKLIEQTSRTRNDHCGTCDAGYRVHDKQCEGYAGSCKNGVLIEQNQRTKDGHCGSCDPGYHLNDGQLCEAYGGSCQNGALIEQKQRTKDGHCGSCDPGYHLNEMQLCEAYGGSCQNGALIEQKQRTKDGHCGSCDPGYHLNDLQHCVAYGGSCKHGVLIEQKQRTKDGQCGSCNAGYYLTGTKQCEAWGGACQNGALVPQRQRTKDGQCGSCNAGYYLTGTKHCEAWSGSCQNGTLVPQSQRTQDDHCGSCSAGYGLNLTRCERCPAGTYSPQGSGPCTGCRLMQRILDQEEWNFGPIPSDLGDECRKTAILRLAEKKHFRNRVPLALQLFYQLHATVLQDEHNRIMVGEILANSTPVLALVQHCNNNRVGELQDKIEFLDFLIRQNTDLRTGSPMDRAIDNDCNQMANLIKEHLPPKTHLDMWKDSFNTSSPIFIGVWHIGHMELWWSIPLALIIGMLGAFLTYRCQQKLHQPALLPVDSVSKGARELAALAYCSFTEEWFQFFMCILAVFAHIIFPLHVCMATVTPFVFLPLYYFSLFIPYLLTWVRPKGWGSIWAGLVLSHGPLKIVHAAFSIARPIFFYILSAWAASPRQEMHMDTAAHHVPPWLKPWYLVRKAAMGRMPHWTLEWIRNLLAEVSVDPYHLMGEERPFGLQWMPKLPTRSLFCCFEALTGYLTLLWCVLALSCLIQNWRAEKGDEHRKEPPRVSPVQQLAQGIHTRLDEIEFEHSEGDLEACCTEGRGPVSELHGLEWDPGKVWRCFLSTVGNRAFAWGLIDFELINTDTGHCKVVRHVCPVSLGVIYKEGCLCFFDVLGDLWQVYNLYLAAYHFFGFVMLCGFTWSLMLQLLRGDPRKLVAEMRESARLGIKTDEYLQIMRWEKGVENLLNLQFTAYALRWSIQTADSLVVGLISLFFTVYAVVRHLFHKGALRSKYEE